MFKIQIPWLLAVFLFASFVLAPCCWLLSGVGVTGVAFFAIIADLHMTLHVLQHQSAAMTDFPS